MVDVKSKKCRTTSCGKVPSFGVAGTKTSEYCAQHAPEGMVNVKNRKRRTEGCGKLPSFGVAGTKTVEYCARHSLDGMVQVKYGKCDKKPSLGVANTRTAEYRAQHTRLPCGVEGLKERKVGPHHSGKETIANAIPSVAIHTSVRPPPTKTSQLSGASRDSRKRVRHQEITSTTSKRAVAREPTAGVVTMPDIDGQKYPVKRNYSVKVEVHLSL
ncbi:unnamed protein product [Ascophyllum nodosum]